MKIASQDSVQSMSGKDLPRAPEAVPVVIGGEPKLVRVDIEGSRFELLSPMGQFGAVISGLDGRDVKLPPGSDFYVANLTEGAPAGLAEAAVVQMRRLLLGSDFKLGTDGTKAYLSSMGIGRLTLDTAIRASMPTSNAVIKEERSGFLIDPKAPGLWDTVGLKLKTETARRTAVGLAALLSSDSVDSMYYLTNNLSSSSGKGEVFLVIKFVDGSVGMLADLVPHGQ